VRVRVLPEGTAVVAVKESEIGTEDLPTTRSEGAIVKETDETREKMLPDATDVEAVLSALVCTLTSPPAVAAPKVKPESVTVTAVLAASVVPEVVMTMEVAPGAAMGPREAPPDTAPLGVAVVAKKLAG
jgi:hypothetical protein